MERGWETGRQKKTVMKWWQKRVGKSDKMGRKKNTGYDRLHNVFLCPPLVLFLNSVSAGKTFKGTPQLV